MTHGDPAVPELNGKLFTQIAEHLESRPEAHMQSAWLQVEGEGDLAVGEEFEFKDFKICNTHGCVAGWAVLFAGEKVAMVGEYADWMVVDREGGYRHIEDVAQDLLGITNREASHLFAAEWAVDLRDESDDAVANLLRKIAGDRTAIFKDELYTDDNTDEYDDESEYA